MDLAATAGTPREYTLTSGEVIRIRPLKLKEWAEVTAWLLDNVPSPMTRAFTQLEVARKAGVTIRDADRDALLRQADYVDQHWPPKPLTWTWITAIDAADGGMAFLAWVVLKHAMPGMTQERAAEIEGEMTDDERNVLFLLAQGKGTPRPKDEAPTSGPAGETSPNPSPSTPENR